MPVALSIPSLYTTVESDFVVGTRKFDSTVHEEKGLLSPSRDEKNKHYRRKIEDQDKKKLPCLPLPDAPAESPTQRHILAFIIY